LVSLGTTANRLISSLGGRPVEPGHTEEVARNRRAEFIFLAE
jgi:hypothetical protein